MMTIKAMSLTSVFRFVFSFRLLAAILLIWILFSTQSIAWQKVNYNPAPNYAAQGHYNPWYRNTNPYVRPPVYPTYNYPRSYPQPVYLAPQAPTSKIVKPGIVEPDIKPLKIEKAVEDKPVKTTSTSESKQIFIDKLLPYIKKENVRLKQLRERISQTIQKLDSNVSISEKTKIWLKKLAKKYRVKGNPVVEQQARIELLNKVDIIPSSLTLAQAANESAWGKSRFATEANNLFGIWTYDEKKGLKPKNRDPDKKHLIRIFDHYGDSVAYYMFTLNSHPAYKKLREIRQQQRKNKTALDGFAIAEGLQKYSAKGDLYIKIIRDLIRKNQWAQLDRNNLQA